MARFPENRYVVLDEVQSFLEAHGVSLKNLIEVLCKASDCYLIFSFGDITIEFSRGFKVEYDNVVWLSVEIQEEDKPNAYEYKIQELEALTRKMPSEIQSFGEI